MTIKELIEKENYDVIDIRLSMPENIVNMFSPKLSPEESHEYYISYKSKNSQLFTLNGNPILFSDKIYNKEIIDSGKWSNENENIYKAITIILQGIWDLNGKKFIGTVNAKL